MGVARTVRLGLEDVRGPDDECHYLAGYALGRDSHAVGRSILETASS
jgi:hypothetical protein